MTSANIIHPFPSSPAAETSSIIERLTSRPSALSPDAFDVAVQGERLTIPARIYVDEMAFQITNLGQRPFADCLLTRHHNSFVRARALGRMITLNQPWSMPFLVQLVGEYVIEILDQIETAFDRIDPMVVAPFVRENPSFMHLTRARVVS